MAVMAYTAATAAAFEAVSKRFYNDKALWTAFVKKMPMLEKIKREDAEFSEQGIYAPFILNLPPNGGARGEDDPLPPYSTGIKKNWYITAPEADYQRGKITGKAIDLCGSRAQAMVKLVETELESAKDAMRLRLARQLYGLGNAILATVTNAEVITGIGVSSTEWLSVGQQVAFFTGNTIKDTTVRHIVAINPAAKTIALDVTLSTSCNGYAIYNYLAKDDGATGHKEMTGLRAIINEYSHDTGNYAGGGGSDSGCTTVQGLSRSTYPQVNALCLTNSSTARVLSAALIHSYMEWNEQEAEETPSAMVGRPYIGRLIAGLGEGFRFQQGTVIDAGFTGAKFSFFDITLVFEPNRLCRRGELLFPYYPDLRIYQDRDIHFLHDKEAGVSGLQSMAISGDRDALGYAFKHLRQLIITASPRNQGFIGDLLAETTAIYTEHGGNPPIAIASYA